MQLCRFERPRLTTSGQDLHASDGLQESRYDAPVIHDLRELRYIYFDRTTPGTPSRHPLRGSLGRFKLPQLPFGPALANVFRSRSLYLRVRQVCSLSTHVSTTRL